MKKVYIKPEIAVSMEVEPDGFLCVSAIGPGAPNTPPSAPSLDVLGDWDDD